MKALFLNSRGLFIEIGQTSLKILDGEAGLDLPLERQENGRLTAACREQVAQSLREFLKRQSRREDQTALCAIGARGVSMRRLALPASSKEELQRLLTLQIESEFPLSPDELAWGYLPVSNGGGFGGAGVKQEVVVFAVKREIVEEYTELLAACGLDAVFTLGATARAALSIPMAGTYSILEVGHTQSELISIENGVPVGLRIISWGGENLTRAIAGKLGISSTEAERVKIDLDQASISDGEVGRKVQSGILDEVGLLAGLVNKSWVGKKLYLSGRTSRLKEMAPSLCQAFGGGVACERIEIPQGPGHSTAILGLKTAWEQGRSGPSLVLQVQKTKAAEPVVKTTHRNWAALAALLLAVSFALRYVEPVLKKPRLARRLSELKTYREKLPEIDRQLNFLQFLDKSQPTYLDTLYVIANSTPGGVRVDSLSMTRRGDLSLRATMQNQQQAIDFRTKLIDSGLFSTIVVEEQTPSPDRQRLVLRLSGQSKPAGERPALSVTNAAPAKAGNNAKPGPGTNGSPATPGNASAKAASTNTEPNK